MFPITISFPRQDWSEASPPPGENDCSSSNRHAPPSRSFCMFARVIEEKLADPSHPRRSLRAGHPDSGGDRWLPHTRSAVAVAPSSSYSRFTHTVDQKVQKVRTDPQWPEGPSVCLEAITFSAADDTRISKRA